MVEVVVTGVGIRSALGNSLGTTWRRLLHGESGIERRQPFPELPPLPLGMVGQLPACIEDLLVPVVEEAIADAGLELPRPECAVAVGSSRAYQREWEKRLRGENLAPWLSFLPAEVSATVARYLGCESMVLSPMAACSTGVWALFQGYELIRTGQCRRAIAGAVEAPIAPLVLTGFDRLGALAKTGCYPFDRGREGLVLGEGAALFILEAKDEAISRGVPIYGQILGFGLTCDAYHRTAPDPGGKSAIACIRQCLSQKELLPTQIDYIHAHGTSTRLNDEREAGLIQTLFGSEVPVSSTKGATGHALGAASAMGVAFCLLANKTQILPPCIGLKQSEFGLNLVKKPREACIEHSLCLSFGFGGQNGAILLGRG